MNHVRSHMGGCCNDIPRVTECDPPRGICAENSKVVLLQYQIMSPHHSEEEYCLKERNKKGPSTPADLCNWGGVKCQKFWMNEWSIGDACRIQEILLFLLFQETKQVVETPPKFTLLTIQLGPSGRRLAWCCVLFLKTLCWFQIIMDFRPLKI